MKEDISKFSEAERAELQAVDDLTALSLEKSRHSIEGLKPILSEIVACASEGVIQITVKDNWEGYSTAVLVTLGDLKLQGECTYSGDILPVGDGGFWYFFPCYGDDGRESWSLNDLKWGHKWFDSTEKMFNHLVPRLAEIFAAHEHSCI